MGDAGAGAGAPSLYRQGDPARAVVWARGFVLLAGTLAARGRAAGDRSNRQSDSFGPRLREFALARGGPGSADARAVSFLEPVRAGRHAAPGRGSGRDLSSFDLARDRAAPAAILDDLLRVHSFPRATIWLSFIARTRD